MDNSVLLCGIHARALRQAHYYGPLFLVMALMPNECSFVIIFPKGRRGLYYILTCCLAIIIWLKFLGSNLEFGRQSLHVDARVVAFVSGKQRAGCHGLARLWCRGTTPGGPG